MLCFASRFIQSVFILTLVMTTATPGAAESYKADPIHSSAVFRIKHAGAAYFYGLFNAPTGTFVLDEADPTRCSFNVQLQAASVITGNDKRDAHLRSPDFFNAKQYPSITFKSTAVKKGEGNTLLVTGDLQLHGVTRSITASIELTGTGEFPPGVKRAGIEATLTVKMSDFEIKGSPGALSDEVKVIVSLEGVKQ